MDHLIKNFLCVILMILIIICGITLIYRYKYNPKLIKII
jgi:hypothetical protein